MFKVGYNFHCQNFLLKNLKLGSFKKSNVNINSMLSLNSKGLSEQRSNDKKFSFNFRNYKYIYAAAIFTSTVSFTLYVKNKKLSSQRKLLEECEQIEIDRSRFKAKVSLYRYKDYVFPKEILLSGILQDLQNFRFRSNDIIVASFPKTGTTWLQEIVYMMTHNCKISGHTDELLETRFPYLEYPYPGLKAIIKQKEQRFIKTHLPFNFIQPSFEDSNAKLIYIYRNPRDTAVSYYHFIKLLTVSAFCGTLQEFINMFLSDKVAYTPFYSHLRSFWNNKDNPNILFIAYEKLKENPIDVIKNIANFLQISLSQEEIFYIAYHTSFEAMSNNSSVNYEHWKDIGFAFKNEGKFMRKGIVGSWKEEMNENMVKQFEEWEQVNCINEDLKFIYS